MNEGRSSVRAASTQASGEYGSRSMTYTTQLTENAIRKRVARRGFKLMKRRSKTYRSLYGDGYMIVNHHDLIVGGGGLLDGYTMTLEECEE